MPFLYDFAVPAIPRGQEMAIFENWELAERDPVSAAGTAIATIRVGERRFRILANGDAFLWKKMVRPGEKIRSTQVLGKLAADGENIPYGRPYSFLEI